jgi:L-asparaginase II
MTYAPLAEVYRGKNVDGVLTDPHLESVHSGIFAVVDEHDRLLLSAGDVHHKTYIRSAAKPFQILPMLASGAIEHFGFTSRECAIICGSHNGEPAHVEAARGVLEKIRLNVTHLQCGAHAPYHDPSAEELIRKGQKFTALHNNCSGKHSGMLTSCVKRNYPVETYLDFDHPLQLEILEYVKEFSGVREIFRGTDGCSAPVFELEVIQMARMFARMGSGKHELLKRSFSIMHAEPFMIGGTNRFDTDLMLHSEVVGKVGGEGIHCIAVPPANGRPAMGVTVKIADGNFRALYPVVTFLLNRLGVLDEEQMQKLAYYVKTPLKNHRKKEIGFITIAPELAGIEIRGL